MAKYEESCAMLCSDRVLCGIQTVSVVDLVHGRTWKFHVTIINRVIPEKHALRSVASMNMHFVSHDQYAAIAPDSE
jgi:hypothetical protein